MYIPYWYTNCMATQQIAVRLPPDLLVRLDDLVRRGIYESRAAAVRAGVEAIAEIEQRRALDRSIVEGYRQTPTSADEAAALESLRQAIVEEPW
jgi:Arc/MetJ-type ribon-helix-helix transcriptional regulator